MNVIPWLLVDVWPSLQLVVVHCLATYQGFIMTEILLRHSFSGEPLLETDADFVSIKFLQTLDRLHRLSLIVHNKSGHSVIYNFGHLARLKRDHWCAARHRLDHHQPKGLRPVDRKQQSCRTRQKRLLGFIVYLTNQLDLMAVDFRL